MFILLADQWNSSLFQRLLILALKQTKMTLGVDSTVKMFFKHIYFQGSFSVLFWVFGVNGKQERESSRS